MNILFHETADCGFTFLFPNPYNIIVIKLHLLFFFCNSLRFSFSFSHSLKILYCEITL